jgi:hypothetical protein
VLHTWTEPLSSSGAPTRGLELATSSREETATAPRWQYFYKPLAPAGASTAVLLMNHDDKAADLTVTFSDVPGVTCVKCKVTVGREGDVEKRADLAVTFSNVPAVCKVQGDSACGKGGGEGAGRFDRFFLGVHGQAQSAW